MGRAVFAEMTRLTETCYLFLIQFLTMYSSHPEQQSYNCYICMVSPEHINNSHCYLNKLCYWIYYRIAPIIIINI